MAAEVAIGVRDIMGNNHDCVAVVEVTLYYVLMCCAAIFYLRY